MRSAARKSGKLSEESALIDADQCDALEVVAFGEHLRADENVESARGECAERFLILALGAGGVAVEASDARAGKFFAQAFFQMLGAFAEEIDVLRLALGTSFGTGCDRAAVVAFEAIARFVVGHARCCSCRIARRRRNCGTARTRNSRGD